MIEFSDVTVAFGNGVTALNNVSFTINKNEFVFLVGASGAGKSTILSCIMGVVKPKKGVVEVGENPVKVPKLKGSRLAKHRQDIGFVFQDFKVLPYKNIFENVLLALKAKDVPAPFQKQEVMDALTKVGLQNKTNEFPVQLSAGELQRVAIARALAGDRHLILADEPTGNLDPKTTWDVMKLFTDLAGQRTILIATHNIDVVNSLKKRTITIDKGAIVSDKTFDTK
ncbi:MAG: ATP-binding cassette domain-containing protein [Patescibacteria group bacterium]